MKVVHGAHLTYCTNIHPGESWAETKSALASYLPRIKRMVSPAAPMGVGLRLSATAALSLEQPEELHSFQSFLRGEDLYVFTINGFPYGSFSGRRVKDQVYLPNWSELPRLAYTNRLANILVQLLPDNVPGSISTVPGAYLQHLNSDRDREKIADLLIQHAAHLHVLHEQTGKFIGLALEPEPGCLLETGADVVNFFDAYLHDQSAAQQMAELTGLARDDAELTLRRHLGLCLDICHLAVSFEEPLAVLKMIQDAGIALHKIQLSAALRVIHPGAVQKQELLPFAEGVYLHQVAASGPAGITRWADLPDALNDAGQYNEWRVHFHVPLWAEKMGSFSTTIDAVKDILASHNNNSLSAHLEIETYTWDVMGAEHKKYDLVASVAKEIEWVRKHLA